MVIEPKIRGFICTTAHPEGCKAAVAEQIQYVESKGHFDGPKNVLVIGASTGYGLASRIAASFGAGAKTIGVFFEREADDKRTATPGWYNSAAFEAFAHQAGLYAKSINGDAFSNEIKRQVADLIRNDFGKVDLIIYSLAAPRRTNPNTGQVYSSVIKPIGKAFSGKVIDAFRNEIKEAHIDPATPEEIENTVAVMGGEDWEMWLDFLKEENLLADGIKTVAYSYIGPDITHAIYKEGTIGHAKEHLKMTADKLAKKLSPLRGEAVLSVNKAVVTQASAAIPVMSLYISILFRVMKDKGLHEGCIEQCYRLLRDNLYGANPPALDAEGYIRVDDLEMRPEVQGKVMESWSKFTAENAEQIADVQGYKTDFYHLFGFAMPGIDYAADVNPVVKIPSIG